MKWVGNSFPNINMVKRYKVEWLDLYTAKLEQHQIMREDEGDVQFFTMPKKLFSWTKGTRKKQTVSFLTSPSLGIALSRLYPSNPFFEIWLIHFKLDQTYLPLSVCAVLWSSLVCPRAHYFLSLLNNSAQRFYLEHGFFLVGTLPYHSVFSEELIRLINCNETWCNQQWLVTDVLSFELWKHLKSAALFPHFLQDKVQRFVFVLFTLMPLGRTTSVWPRKKHSLPLKTVSLVLAPRKERSYPAV